MARTREFDTDQVLDAATDAFWRHGFEATSLQDLMEATGLHKGSLYQAFGDKHSLFLAVLERYLDKHAEITRDVFRSLPPAEAIPAWIGKMHEFSGDDGSTKGCLAWNTVMELTPHDEEAKKVIHRHFDRMRPLFVDLFTRGQAEGVFRTDVSPENLAAYFFTVAAGTVAMEKADYSKVDPSEVLPLVMRTLQS